MFAIGRMNSSSIIRGQADDILRFLLLPDESDFALTDQELEGLPRAVLVSMLLCLEDGDPCSEDKKAAARVKKAIAAIDATASKTS